MPPGWYRLSPMNHIALTSSSRDIASQLSALDLQPPSTAGPPRTAAALERAVARWQATVDQTDRDVLDIRTDMIRLLDAAEGIDTELAHALSGRQE